MTYQYRAPRTSAVVTPQMMNLRAEADTLRRSLERRDRIIAALLNVTEPEPESAAERHRRGLARRSMLTAEIDAHREARCHA